MPEHTTLPFQIISTQHTHTHMDWKSISHRTSNTKFLELQHISTSDFIRFSTTSINNIYIYIYIYLHSETKSFPKSSKLPKINPLIRNFTYFSFVSILLDNPLSFFLSLSISICFRTSNPHSTLPGHIDRQRSARLLSHPNFPILSQFTHISRIFATILKKFGVTHTYSLIRWSSIVWILGWNFRSSILAIFYSNLFARPDIFILQNGFPMSLYLHLINSRALYSCWSSKN